MYIRVGNESKLSFKQRVEQMEFRQSEWEKVLMKEDSIKVDEELLLSLDQPMLDIQYLLSKLEIAEKQIEKLKESIDTLMTSNRRHALASLDAYSLLSLLHHRGYIKYDKKGCPDNSEVTQVLMELMGLPKAFEATESLSEAEADK